MGLRKMTHEMAISTNVRPIRGFEVTEDNQQHPKRPHWFKRAALWTGVIMAATTPERPNGWQISPAVVTLTILILGMVASGGYYIGLKDAENRQILERLQKAENDARIAKDLGLAKSGEVGHSNTNTEKKK